MLDSMQHLLLHDLINGAFDLSANNCTQNQTDYRTRSFVERLSSYWDVLGPLKRKSGHIFTDWDVSGGGRGGFIRGSSEKEKRLGFILVYYTVGTRNVVERPTKLVLNQYFVLLLRCPTPHYLYWSFVSLTLKKV